MEPFHLVAIGAGTAGLTAAAGAAALGARVALVERDALGGECLHTGCVPTKALVHAARVVRTVARASEFGVHVRDVHLDYTAARQHMLRTMALVGRHDAPERFERMGVRILHGSARFTAPHRLEVDGEPVEAGKFVIATGSRSVAPAIPGLQEAGFWTHVEAIRAEQLPPSIVVLGAGPIGLEFAQVWARFGVKVTVLERFPQILVREDPEAAALVRSLLEAEGIVIRTGVEVTRVAVKDGVKVVTGKNETGEVECEGAEIFVAAGRAPNLEELNLSVVGVQHDKRAVKVDAGLRTTARHVWAAGDCAGPYLFTHTAFYQGQIVAGNALFPLQRQVDHRVVPWTTFLDPEIGHLGLTEPEARERHGDYVRVFRYALSDLDRAIADGETSGFVKVITDRAGAILGAHLVGPAGGDLLHELALAMRSGIRIGAVAQMIHAYPTRAEAIQRVAGEYWRQRLFSPSSPTARLLRRAVALFN